jgi:hypothetical protein
MDLQEPPERADLPRLARQHILDLAERHGLTIRDPRGDAVTRPQG